MQKKFGSVGIYAIRSKLTGRAYIGSSKDIGDRWRSHIISLNMGTNNKVLQAEWNITSDTDWTFEVLLKMVAESTDAELLLEEQRHWDIEVDGGRMPFNKRPDRRGKKLSTPPPVETSDIVVDEG